MKLEEASPTPIGRRSRTYLFERDIGIGDPSYMENDSSYHAFLIDGRFVQEARSLNSIYSIRPETLRGNSIYTSLHCQGL